MECAEKDNCTDDDLAVERPTCLPFPFFSQELRFSLHAFLQFFLVPLAHSPPQNHAQGTGCRSIPQDLCNHKNSFIAFGAAFWLFLTLFQVWSLFLVLRVREEGGEAFQEGGMMTLALIATSLLFLSA